ncbi:unnamed protein product, partial [Discosporangium mesarthrocarpum]
QTKSGKTYDQIAREVGLTNAYLFFNQAQLKPSRVDSLRKVVQGISESDLVDMQRCPYRCLFSFLCSISFDPSVREEPLVHGVEEPVHQYGEGLESIMDKKVGDGIMSAIDF